LDFFFGSEQGWSVAESIRSSSFLGTSRTPRSFADGSVSLAIQRLTVLTETRAKRVMSRRAESPG